MSNQEILKQFREKFTNLRADIYNDGHEQDITNTVESWLSTILDQVREDVTEDILKNFVICKKCRKKFDEKYPKPVNAEKFTIES